MSKYHQSRSRSSRNVVQEKKYTDRLIETLNNYHNRSIEKAQVIEELIGMAKDFQEQIKRDESLGLNPDEVAFYAALAENESAVRELGDEILKKIAVEITDRYLDAATEDTLTYRDSADINAPDAESSTIPHSSHREYYRSVAALGIQAATALQHAHDEGIIHRDVKPANLILDGTAKLYLTDFGLARIEADAGVTMTGDLIGTLRYMAPEQALAKRVVVDHRADIYSLAATLYELHTLRPAYVAEDRQELLKNIAFENPVALRRIDRDIPAEMETIVRKAMSKDMDQRYATSQELADDLQSYLENRPIKAEPPTVVALASKWVRRNPVIAWSTFVTLAFVTITLAISIFVISNQLARATTAERASASRAADLERHNYLMHIAAADHALLRKRYVQAQSELDACPPNLRGWEWRYQQKRRQAVIPYVFPAIWENLTQDGERLHAVEKLEHVRSSDSPQGDFVTTWDIDSGEVINRLELSTRVHRLIVSNNERRIAVSNGKGSLIVRNVANGEELWHVDLRAEAVSRDRIIPIAFSLDDRWLVCSVNNNSFRVFQSESGREKLRSDSFVVDEGKNIFSPDGRWLVAVEGKLNSEKRCVVLEVPSGEVAAVFPGESRGGRPWFDSSGQRIAKAHSDGMIRVWNWDGKRIAEENSWRAADHSINRVAFSADGRRLVSSDRKNAVKVWSVQTGELLSKLDSRGEVYGVAFRPRSDDEQIIVGSAVDGTRFWRWRSSVPGDTIEALTGAVKVSFSPDGRSILASTPAYFTGGNTYNHQHLYYPAEPAVILNAESSSSVRTDDAVYATSWTPDGQEIIATPASGNTTLGDAIRTYDAQTGRATSRSYPGHTGKITISRFSASDGRLISFSNDWTIRAFDFASGEEVMLSNVRHMLGNGGPGSSQLYYGTAADFSPDASLIGLAGVV